MKRIVYMVLAVGTVEMNGEDISMGINGCIGMAPIFDNEPDAFAWAERNRQNDNTIASIIELEHNQ